MVELFLGSEMHFLRDTLVKVIFANYGTFKFWLWLVAIFHYSVPNLDIVPHSLRRGR